MEVVKDKNSRSALITTLLVLIGLFLLFINFGFIYKVPIPSQSIVINFGNSDEGTGEIQPQESAAAASSSPSDPAPSKAITQDAPSPVSTPDAKKTTQPDPEPVKNPDPEVNKKALFPGSNKQNVEGGSEGETGKTGDQGNPEGDRNSMSHTGTTDGSGTNYQLGVRKALVKPKLRYNCPEEGKVVVNISVDREGKVVKATPGGRGTTNAASCLLEKAREAAMQTRWESDPEAPELQSGQIIYNFQLD